ncbi:MAG: hypothetical protein R3345_10000, partial [Fulvivirga sp.]|nr:hypothetical protein [Fulvivirga sp.]
KALEEAQILKLLTLEIPDGDDSESTTAASGKLKLDCSQLLPLQLVKDHCGVAGVKLNVTDFEKETNCNRKYGHPDNFGGLVFIVTQYNDMNMATQAVKAKLEDEDLDSKAIKNLGDLASIVTVGEDLFLSVAHKNYLLELRSSNGVGPQGTCCVCLDDEKLKFLAKNVLEQLP